MSRFKHMVLALGGLALMPLAYSQTFTSVGMGLSMMNLNASTLKGQALSMKDLWGRMRQDFRMSEVNPEIVRRQEQYYSSKSSYFNRTVSRSQPYLYHILSEVEKRRMPAEIALLPFIESAFVTKAKSPVGASGLWQFMPATGRHYGLEQTNFYDGRHDIYAATDAALNYLQYLHGLFGDWSLALAAYNWGEGNVAKAIARAQAAGLDPVYENLRMPNETRNYVPKLLAVRNIINNPQAFGIDLASIANKPYFEAISIDQPLDIQAAARLANIPTSEFLALNPGFKVPVFVPKENRKMLLPISAVNTFENNYSKANKSSLLSWDLYTAPVATNIADLAAETGMSISEIKRINGISGNTLAAGKSILLNKNSLASVGLNSFADNDDLLAAAMAKADMQPVLPVHQGVTPPAEAAALNNDTVVAVTAAPLPVTPNIQTASVSAATNTDKAVAVVPVAATTVASAPAAVPAQPDDSRAVALLNQAQQPAPTVVQTAQNISVAAAPSTALPADAAAPAAATTASDDALMALAKASGNRLSEEIATPDNGNTAAQLTAEESRQARERVERVMKTALASATPAAAAKTENATKPENTDNARTHKVAAGDTLFSIAQRYNLNVADLVTANNLKGSNIRAGQVLDLAAARKAGRQAAARLAAAKDKSNIRPVSYTVKRGDTLTSIAQRLNVPVSSLQKINKGTYLRPGQKLNLTNM